MRSIYDHKQYDVVSYDSAYYAPPITRQLYDISWQIVPRRDGHLRDYHEREINLNFLDNVVNDINYKYMHYSNYKERIYTYSDGHLSFNKKTFLITREVKLKMEFEEACQYIKDEEGSNA